MTGFEARSGVAEAVKAQSNLSGAAESLEMLDAFRYRLKLSEMLDAFRYQDRSTTNIFWRIVK
jgi:hypothetical protein